MYSIFNSLNKQNNLTESEQINQENNSSNSKDDSFHIIGNKTKRKKMA